ncbi:flagellar hook-associated protein FlgL [Photobacterium sanguinicancri]|uniref:Flagellar hook-associated protein FlgL n=1 Tax=Photobacterium sanguinicancri TaxID=875932 RepID=A0AAW7Y798_9GAMM|nr:flagellar hook-associated protein FlgL [Photobacterium sanguinicancri]MDO6543840.1 flagellar hook-associated protein FlgL [Photobacterium sanguinicancri]
MRISTSQMNNIMLTSMQSSTTGVNKSFIQLNSGERMLKPSDDPLGAVQLMMLDREQADISQFKKNISNLTTQLGQTESHLDASNTAVLRAQELVTGILSASNSTMEGREAIATELDGILGQLTDIANSKNPNGDYIFAGTKTDTQPIAKDPATGEYVYQGNSDQREVQVAESMSIPANQTADVMFSNGSDNIFNTLDSVINDLRNPAIDGSNLTSSVTQAQTDIKSTLSSINGALTDVGGQQNSLTMISGSHDDNKLINDKLIGDVKDLDYSQAILELNTQMAALQATQMTYSKVQNLSLFKLM